VAADAWSAERYAAHARFVSDLGAPVAELLAPRRGERILDLGCGDGALTAQLLGAGAEVVGLDASPDMVAAARARGIDAREGDAAALPFEAEFDAVFSNAALHWVTRAAAAVEGIARALRPGGRFVAEFGGFGNVAAIRTALVAVLAREGVTTTLDEVWFFPTPEDYAARLARAGLAVEEIALVPRPTRVESGMAAWLETLAAPVLAKLPEGRRSAATAAAEALLAPALRDGAGTWWADYVRLRVRAQRSG
jgi:SAM-dependent methyltransferase